MAALARKKTQGVLGLSKYWHKVLTLTEMSGLVLTAA
jgi:hypothetical protein